jgi:hypothetical protein
MIALINAFLDACAIDNLSPHTIARYRSTLEHYRCESRPRPGCPHV